MQQASGRAHDQLRAAEGNLADAESVLARAEREAPARLAQAFVTGGRIGDGGPVEHARSNVSTIQTEIDHLGAVEEALAIEIGKVRGTLRTLTAQRYAAMSELVTTDPAYHSLLAAHSEGWARLRTVRIALQAVNKGLGGAIPQALLDLSQHAEPLEERVGYPVDKQFVSAWSDAMAALEQDADVELPHV